MSIADNIYCIQSQINRALLQSHRDLNSVELLAVSKGQSVTAIEDAFLSGINNFGENYWQELREKIKLLSHLPLNWHFIGPIQSNKSAEIATHCQWVHSVDRIKIAQLLHKHRPLQAVPLNVCIQVNLDDESQKGGVSNHDIFQLASEIIQLPRLILRGLMAIPKLDNNENKDEQYATFLRLTHLKKQLNSELNLTLDTLSMGMSNDFFPAIKAGSTIVRIGRAIFGERR